MNDEELKREIRDAYYNDDMYLRYDLVDAVEDIVDENAKLRKACAELLVMAEQHDPEWLHWPEMHEELRKLGVEVD